MNHFLLLLAFLLLHFISHGGSTSTIRRNHEVLLVKLLFYAKDPLLDTLQHLNHLLLKLLGTRMRISCIQGPQKHSRWQCGLLTHLLLKLHSIPFEDIAKLFCILLLWSISSSFTLDNWSSCLWDFRLLLQLLALCLSFLRQDVLLSQNWSL